MSTKRMSQRFDEILGFTFEKGEKQTYGLLTEVRHLEEALKQGRSDAAELRERNETLMLSLTNERETTNVLCEHIRLLEQAATRVRDEIDDRTHGETYSGCSDWWNILLDVLPDSPA